MQTTSEKAGDDLKSAGEDVKDTAKNLESGARDKADDFKSDANKNAKEAKSEAKAVADTGDLSSAKAKASKAQVMFLSRSGGMLTCKQ